MSGIIVGIKSSDMSRKELALLLSSLEGINKIDSTIAIVGGGELQGISSGMQPFLTTIEYTLKSFEEGDVDTIIIGIFETKSYNVVNQKKQPLVYEIDGATYVGIANSDLFDCRNYIQNKNATSPSWHVLYHDPVIDALFFIPESKKDAFFTCVQATDNDGNSRYINFGSNTNFIAEKFVSLANIVFHGETKYSILMEGQEEGSGGAEFEIALFDANGQLQFKAVDNNTEENSMEVNSEG